MVFEIENNESAVNMLRRDPKVWKQVQQLLLGAAIGNGETNESANYRKREVLESMFGIDDSLTGQIFEVASTEVGQVGNQLDVYFENGLPNNQEQLEAIIEVTGRPPLLIQNGDWENPVIDEVKTRLESHRQHVQPRLASIGRIQKTVEHETRMIGTGWMIEKDVLVTNRHVAEAFARKTQDGTNFEFTVPSHAITTDFKREYDIANELTVGIIKILNIVDEATKDIAFLKVEKRDTAIPEHLQLHASEPTFEQHVVCIGYPARDSRNDFFAMLKYFKDIYEVKRLSPGQLTGVEHTNWIQHDCTTLGGSSGSAVLDVESGEVVGLHFSGKYRKLNLAVKSSIVKRELAKL